MTAPLAILCYHRVMPDTARHGAGWPYFARGTAVSITTFARQVEALAARFALLDETTARAWAHGHHAFQRPSVWITFDDGYAEFEAHAAPVLMLACAPASLFITTCTLATPPRPLAADRWYAALVRARRRRGMLRQPVKINWSFSGRMLHRRHEARQIRRRYSHSISGACARAG
jgi:peptidoglycan/xylan/chitin deacetylase (PgdA/CDA1 family)